MFFLFSVVAVVLAISVWSAPANHYLAWISERDADILHRAGHGGNEQMRRLGVPAFPPYAWYRMSGYPGYHGRRRLQ